jgi:hypothetical protein
MRRSRGLGDVYKRQVLMLLVAVQFKQWAEEVRARRAPPKKGT